MFLIYLVLTVISIGLAFGSIVPNLYSGSGADWGSVFLAVGNLLVLPAAFGWIVLPYWLKFPKVAHPPCEDIQPTPWPFGNEKIPWAAMGFSGAAWIALMSFTQEAIDPAGEGLTAIGGCIPDILIGRF